MVGINEERIWACRSAKWLALLSEGTSQHSGPTEIECIKYIITWNCTSVRSSLAVCTRANHMLKLVDALHKPGHWGRRGCRGCCFCHSGSKAAIAQVLVQEGVPASSPGKYLRAETDFGHHSPDLDSCPLPRVAPQLPRRSPLHTRGERQPFPWILLAAARGVPCFPVEEMKIGHLFVENIDFFLQLCYWETKLCLRFNYHYLVWGSLFVF